MNDNVRKIFDMLGVEPNEEFNMLLGDSTEFSFNCKIDARLQGYYLYGEDWIFFDELLKDLLNGSNTIVKLPKEPKKKKLRDITLEEYRKWCNENCSSDNCSKCIFDNVYCNKVNPRCWVHHKDLYSDKFLDQEIEVEE